MVRKLGLMCLLASVSLLQAMNGSASQELYLFDSEHLGRIVKLTEQNRLNYYLEIRNEMIKSQERRLNLDLTKNKLAIMQISQTASVLAITEIEREAAVAEARKQGKAAQAAKDDAAFGNGFKKGFFNNETNKKSKK